MFLCNKGILRARHLFSDTALTLVIKLDVSLDYPIRMVRSQARHMCSDATLTLFIKLNVSLTNSNGTVPTQRETNLHLDGWQSREP